MGLAIGLVKDGAVYVDDIKITVSKIVHSLNFQVTVHTSGMNQIFTITDQKATEVLPNVMVSAGNKGSDGMVKMVIDAPQHKKILREKLWLQERENGGSSA